MMQSIYINKKNYYFADDIINNAPIFCKGIRNGREFIRKKNIDDYEYVRLDNSDKWIVADGKSVKFDKVIIRKIYVDKIKELNDDDDVVDDHGTEKAPNIIKLNKNEKFKDSDGNILDIETREQRKCDKIFFKVKDVANEFEMPNLQDTVLDVRRAYVAEKHYKFFMCEKTGNASNSPNKKITKELFLTYEGMLRVLFVSKNGKTKNFIKWAVETLFVVQMGATKQKTKLAASILHTKTMMKNIVTANMDHLWL